MKELRTAALMLGLLVGAAAVAAFVCGPLTWWLTPAEAQQLPPVQRLAAEQDTREWLIRLMIGGAIVAAIYWAFAILTHVKNNR
jgi:hypothetical protein